MVFSFVVVAFSVAWARWHLALPFPWENEPFPDRLGKIWLARNFYWLVLGGLVLGLVDSIFVFRRFAKASQEPPSARAFLK
jgi:hypothetical protein